MASQLTRQQRNLQRWARRGTTAQRGLGSDHTKTRQQALATMPDGQPCARCEQAGIYHPMSRALIGRSRDGKRYVAPLLDLDDFPGRMYGGPQIKRLSFRSCNRSAGARAGNQLRGAIRKWASARQW